MNRLIPSLLLASALSASAQQPQDALNRRIALQEQVVQEAQNRLVELDARIEKGITTLVSDLSGWTDSKESGTRVAGIKKDVIEGLRQSLVFYQRERDLRLAEVVRVAQSQTTTDLSNDVVAVESRMDRRVAQILDLSASLAQQKGYQQYEYYGDGWGGVQKKETEDYRHNEREVSKTGQIQRDVVEGLRKNVDDLTRRNSVLKTQAAAVNDVRDRALLEGEILRNEELMELRREQVRDVLASESEGADALSRQEAFQMDQLVADQVVVLRRQFNELKRLASERDAARTRLQQLRLQRPPNSQGG